MVDAHIAEEVRHRLDLRLPTGAARILVRLLVRELLIRVGNLVHALLHREPVRLLDLRVRHPQRGPHQLDIVVARDRDHAGLRSILGDVQQHEHVCVVSAIIRVAGVERFVDFIGQWLAVLIDPRVHAHDEDVLLARVFFGLFDERKREVRAHDAVGEVLEDERCHGGARAEHEHEARGNRGDEATPARPATSRLGCVGGSEIGIVHGGSVRVG